MVELYLNDDLPGDEKSMTYVANQLTAEGIMARGGKPFRINIIKDTLVNPNLFGYQEVFGFWWKAYPAVIDEETYWRVQEKVKRRAGAYTRATPPASQQYYLMTGLLKCWCGYSMVAQRAFSGDGFYRCCAPDIEHKHGWHGKLRRDKVDPFFDALMQQHSAKVLEVIIDKSDGAQLMQELRDLQEHSLKNEQKRKQIEAQREQEAKRELVEQEGVPETDEDFPAFLRDRLRLKTRDLRKQAEAEQKRIKTLSERVGQTRPKEEIDKTWEVLTRWSDLTITQRNRILRDIFSHLQLGGEKPNEYLTPHLRVASADEVILPIDVEYIARGKGERRLQDPGRWLAAMYATENREEHEAEAIAEAIGDEEGLAATVTVEEWGEDDA